MTASPWMTRGEFNKELVCEGAGRFRETGKGAAAPRAGKSGEPLREQQCGEGCLMVGNHW